MRSRAARRARLRRRIRLRRTIATAILALAALSVITWLADPFGLREDASPEASPERPAPAVSETPWPAPPPPAPLTSAGAPTAAVTPKGSSVPADAPASGPATSAPAEAPAADTAGKGTFRDLPVVAPPAASSPASLPPQKRLVRYVLQAEDGVPLDDRHAATSVAATLADPRGWRAADGVAFQQIPGDQVASADMVIMLSSPLTTDRLCRPLPTQGEYSCQPLNSNQVVLNLRRWAAGVPWYADDLELYRSMLVNHEVGHFLGHDHEKCPGPGKPAPIMQQQSISLAGCTRNPYPAVR